jgi:hypothetical protein
MEASLLPANLRREAREAACRFDDIQSQRKVAIGFPRRIQRLSCVDSSCEPIMAVPDFELCFTQKALPAVSVRYVGIGGEN